MGFWGDLPIGQVIRLQGSSPEALALSLEPLPDGAPAIVTYYPDPTTSLSGAVTSILDKLHQIAIELFPTWLPRAERLDGPGGGGVAAVRALAMERAAITGNFGPFLADLAEQSLRGSEPRPSQFAAEICARELTKIIATSFKRSHFALLLHPPTALSSTEAYILGALSDWLAHQGGMSVWVTGVLPSEFDRFQTQCVALDVGHQTGFQGGQLSAAKLPDKAAILYPPIAGRPRPASEAERALETALGGCEWAGGRAWNQTFQVHALTNSIRVDLLWAKERCIVEVDGPEHRGALKFEADRRRDVHLQLEGFAVLRFTKAQVLDNVAAVLSQIERYIQYRRAANDGWR